MLPPDGKLTSAEDTGCSFRVASADQPLPPSRRGPDCGECASANSFSNSPESRPSWPPAASLTHPLAIPLPTNQVEASQVYQVLHFSRLLLQESLVDCAAQPPAERMSGKHGG